MLQRKYIVWLLILLTTSVLPRGVQAAVGNCKEQNLILSFPNWYKGLKCEDNGHGPVVFEDLSNLWTITGNVLDMAIQAAGLIAVFMIIYGGIRYITSQGEPDNIQSAKKTITYAIGGLVLAILASTLVGFIAGQF